MVVRGDGSLVSAAFVRERPIETILSGPAASLVGAAHLTGARRRDHQRHRRHHHRHRRAARRHPRGQPRRRDGRRPPDDGVRRGDAHPRSRRRQPGASRRACRSAPCCASVRARWCRCASSRSTSRRSSTRCSTSTCTNVDARRARRCGADRRALRGTPRRAGRRGAQPCSRRWAAAWPWRATALAHAAAAPGDGPARAAWRAADRGVHAHRRQPRARHPVDVRRVGGAQGRRRCSPATATGWARPIAPDAETIAAHHHRHARAAQRRGGARRGVRRTTASRPTPSRQPVVQAVLDRRLDVVRLGLGLCRRRWSASARRPRRTTRVWLRCSAPSRASLPTPMSPTRSVRSSGECACRGSALSAHRSRVSSWCTPARRRRCSSTCSPPAPSRWSTSAMRCSTTW